MRDWLDWTWARDASFEDGSLTLSVAFADVRTVTVEEFEAWLASKWAWQRVGRSFDGYGCPLACYMREVRGVKVPVCPVPRSCWQHKFITLVDQRRWSGQRVSARLAQRLLSRATADA